MSEHQLIVALGAWRYRVERPFGAWAVNSGFVSDVVVMADSSLRVLLRHDALTQPADDRVIVLDANGRQTGGWGGKDIADSHLMTPGPDGTLLVVDRDMHEVIVFDSAGKRLKALGHRGMPGAPFNHPSDVAVSSCGDVYVSDGYAASRVHRFSAAGRLTGSWGELGEEPGQFGEPHAIWALTNGRVAVVDRVCNRVQVFDPSGRFKEQWTGFYRPVAIWGDATDHVFVIDQTPCLHLFSPTGERIGRCRPVLNGAHGVFGAANGDIYLAESSPSRLTRLVRL